MLGNGSEGSMRPVALAASATRLAAAATRSGAPTSEDAAAAGRFVVTSFFLTIPGPRIGNPTVTLTLSTTLGRTRDGCYAVRNVRGGEDGH